MPYRPPIDLPPKEAWYVGQLRQLCGSGTSIKVAAEILGLSYLKAKALAAKYSIPVVRRGNSTILAAAKAGLIPHRRYRPKTNPNRYYDARNLLAAIVAGNLRKRRKALKLSQAEVAKRAGLWVSVYNRIEIGANLPNLPTLYLLAHVLECSITDLIPVEPPKRVLDIMLPGDPELILYYYDEHNKRGTAVTVRAPVNP
jgi:transcriptional regulator with XRE-family HTH domain